MGDAREEVDTKHERGADPTVDIDDGDTLGLAPQSGSEVVRYRIDTPASTPGRDDRMGSDDDLEYPPHRGVDICVPLAHRDPAQVHARSPTSPATPFAKRNRLTNSDREAMDDGPVVAGRSSGMEVQDDKRQMLDEMQRHRSRLDGGGGQLKRRLSTACPESNSRETFPRAPPVSTVSAQSQV